MSEHKARSLKLLPAEFLDAALTMKCALGEIQIDGDAKQKMITAIGAIVADCELLIDLYPKAGDENHAEKPAQSA